MTWLRASAGAGKAAPIPEPRGGKTQYAAASRPRYGLQSGKPAKGLASRVEPWVYYKLTPDLTSGVGFFVLPATTKGGTL